MTMKSPFWIFPCSRPFSIASSPSKQLAVPEKTRPSLPVIFATEPSVQRLPRRILMLPVLWMHFSTGRITSCVVKSRSGTAARFWARVWPVTVMHSPCSHPSFRRYFMITGVPPILWTSSMRYLPLGLRSAMSGVFALMRWKSSMLRSMSAVVAMARRWSTAFVEPPRAFTTTMAFSKDFFVRMSSGFRFLSSSWRITGTSLLHSSRFSGDSAGIEELPGRDRPMASIAQAIVFAVYMPPHAPAPGMALRTTSARAASSMPPVMKLPYASNVDTMSSVSPLHDKPEAMLPP
mmetsp:Transcript_81464/g.213877  ORF Transcript_81464/g.213877 Transcript_81464/m.213877 type:complete len:291 (+) Transcript_81464:459-1331(+)